jgi:hypothetical protein
MMMHYNTIADLKSFDGIADFYYGSRGLVPQHRRCFPTDVPGEGVACADSANRHFYQGVTGSWFREWRFFDPNIIEIVEAGNTHGCALNPLRRDLLLWELPRI